MSMLVCSLITVESIAQSRPDFQCSSTIAPVHPTDSFKQILDFQISVILPNPVHPFRGGAHPFQNI